MASTLSSAVAARLLGKAPTAIAAGFSAVTFVTSNNNQERSTTTLKCEAPASPQPAASRLQTRMTSIGHFSVLSQTKYNPSIISFVMALSGEKPLTTTEFATLWKDRGMMERHPRFHQKLSADQPGYYVPTTQDYYTLEEDRHPVEDHISETLFPSVYRLDVKHRLQEMQTSTWDLTDSLWRVVIAPWGALGSSGCIDEALLVQQKQRDVDSGNSARGESLLFFQLHHALGDGSSLAAATLDLVDEAEEFRQEIIKFMKKRRGKAKGLLERILRSFQNWVLFTGGSIQAFFYQLRLYWGQLWDSDPWSKVRRISQERSLKDGDVVERNISWAFAAPLEQVKWVARELGGKKVTVNDLFCTCVTAALSRQLDEHRKRLSVLADDTNEEPPLPQQSHMHISLPVHLKGGVVLPGESIGNNIGGMVARLPGEREDMSPEQRLMAVHRELATVKRTPAALLSHLLAKGMSYSARVLPSSWIAKLYSQAGAGSIAVVSNNRGAPKHIHVSGRRVEAIHGFVPLPPGIPIGVVVMSYAGNVSLTVTAEPWAVPDADLFLSFVLEEYLKLLDSAKLKTKEAKV